MSETKRKGKVAELAIMRHCAERGYVLSLPMNDDAPYDLIVDRRLPSEAPQRVQCKYTESDGRVIQVRCRATNNWSEVRYTARTVDWIATYDATTDACVFVPAIELGPQGRTMIHLRLDPPTNGQRRGIRWASAYVDW